MLESSVHIMMIVIGVLEGCTPFPDWHVHNY
jgi:hypothetical protein